MKIFGITVTLLLLFVSLTAATYAWFTSNRIVNTDRVSSRSGSETLTLQVSQTGGNNFRGSEEAAIVQVNKTVRTELLPVSTADLKTFVYNPATLAGKASEFQVVKNENYYYHGRVYLMAKAEGQPEGSRMALYFDQTEKSGGSLVTSQKGLLLNAARMGLTFDGKTPLIFRLSNKTNSKNNQVRNTVLNGKTLGDNKVLSGTGGTIRQANDPAVSISDYSISMNNGSTALPDKPLLYMELNRVYTVDIYFYLEGCDPDCSDSVKLNGADLHLSFFGILTE